MLEKKEVPEEIVVLPLVFYTMDDCRMLKVIFFLDERYKASTGDRKNERSGQGTHIG